MNTTSSSIPDRESVICARLEEIEREAGQLREELAQIQAAKTAQQVETTLASPSDTMELKERPDFQHFVDTVRRDGTWAVYCSDHSRAELPNSRKPIPGFVWGSGYQGVDLKSKTTIETNEGFDKYLLRCTRLERHNPMYKREPVIIVAIKDNKMHMVLQILENGSARDEHNRSCQFCFEVIFPKEQEKYVLAQLKTQPYFMSTLIENLAPEVYALMRENLPDGTGAKTLPRIRLPEKIQVLQWMGSGQSPRTLSGGPFPIQL